MHTTSSKLTLAALTAATVLCGQATAADWSDTSIGYRYGTDFAEPYVGDGITKNIFSITHASGYKYGTNFFNLDLLESDAKDSNAQEAYVVYRNTLDFGKIAGQNYGFGPVRGFGATVGFDWNTKNDPGYASRKRMLVAGPTVMFDVPGFLNLSLLLLDESNQPVGVTNRYTYDLHPMLSAAWGIPFANNWAFEGYADYIGAKGSNEYGGPTAPEFNFDGQVMYDVGSLVNAGKNNFRAGFEYQYWRNKFGNPAGVPGSLAKTPMVRVEYHF